MSIYLAAGLSVELKKKTLVIIAPKNQCVGGYTGISLFVHVCVYPCVCVSICLCVCLRTKYYFLSKCWRGYQVTLSDSLIYSLVKLRPLTSVTSMQDLRTGGCWFDLYASQYSFQGMMIAIQTGFFPLSPLSIIWMQVVWK